MDSPPYHFERWGNQHRNPSSQDLARGYSRGMDCLRGAREMGQNENVPRYDRHVKNFCILPHINKISHDCNATLLLNWRSGFAATQGGQSYAAGRERIETLLRKRGPFRKKK